MRHGVRVSVAVSLTIFIGAVLLWTLPSRSSSLDARIDGRKLSQWASDLQSRDSQINDRARLVLQQNSRAALKFFTTELQATDSFLERGIFALLRACGVQRKINTAAERHHRAIRGLRAVRGSTRLSQEAINALSAHLLSTNTGRASLNTLINVGSGEEIPPELIPALTNALRSPDRSVRVTALTTLKYVPPNHPVAVEALQRCLGDKDPGIRRTAALSLQALAKDNKEQGVTALLCLLQDPDPGFKGHAISRLAPYGPAASPAIPALIELAKGEDPKLRERAVYALGRIGGAPHQMLPLLGLLLSDTNPIVRRNAVYAIGAFETAATNQIPALKHLKQQDPDLEVRVATIFAIRQIQPANE